MCPSAPAWKYVSITVKFNKIPNIVLKHSKHMVSYIFSSRCENVHVPFVYYGNFRTLSEVLNIPETKNKKINVHHK